MELIQIYMAVQGRAQREGMDVSMQLWLWMGAWGEGGCCCTPVCLHLERCLRPDTLAGSLGMSSQCAPELHPPQGWGEWEEEEEDPHCPLPGVFLN